MPDSSSTAESHQPPTFRERGLAIAFTTPVLAGARARRAGGLEFLVPNPSGGRGIYVLGWEGVRGICTPTLHDSRLAIALDGHNRAHGEFTPAALRRVTRRVLGEGFAGRQAALASAAASTAAELLVGETRRSLLARLGRPDGDKRARAALSPVMRELERASGAEAARAQAVMARIAKEAGIAPTEVAAALDRLAQVVADLGIDDEARTGFVPRTLAELAEMMASISQAEGAGILPRGGGRFLLENAELTSSLARRATDAARARLADAAGALAEWVRAPAAMQEVVARPEWLLDGWPRICQLSRTLTRRPDPAVTVAEMAMLVPPMPSQADEWLSLPPGTATRANPMQQGWRGFVPGGERVHDVVARNEQLLAMAA